MKSFATRRPAREYVIAEGWHTVVGALTLDGKDLRDVAVTFEATSDDGTRVHVPRKFSFTDLDAGVEAGNVEIHEDYQQKFGLATVRAADREAPKREQRDFAQAYEIRDALKRAGVSERDLPGTEALMARLPDLRKRAANVERDPWKNVTKTDIMAKSWCATISVLDGPAGWAARRNIVRNGISKTIARLVSRFFVRTHVLAEMAAIVREKGAAKTRIAQADELAVPPRPSQKRSLSFVRTTEAIRRPPASRFTLMP
jgi:hypothetical protein